MTGALHPVAAGDQENRREDGQDHGFRVTAGLYVEKRQKRDAEPGDELFVLVDTGHEKKFF